MNHITKPTKKGMTDWMSKTKTFPSQWGSTAGLKWCSKEVDRIDAGSDEATVRVGEFEDTCRIERI